MKELDKENVEWCWVVNLTVIKDGQGVGTRWKDKNGKIKYFSSEQEAHSAWQDLEPEEKKYGNEVLFLKIPNDKKD